MSDRVFEGTIDHWSDRGDAGFGFITFSMGGPRLDRVFFSHNDIACDAIGRRLHGRMLGNLVRFSLGKHVHRGQPTARAFNIESVFPTDVGNPEDHREVSVVDHILKGTRNPIAAVFLRRSSGDKLYLGYNGVADPYKDQFQNLTVGRMVWHGVRTPTGNQSMWEAVHSEFYSDAEESQMREERSNEPATA